jgi:hypothetical protein
MRYRCYFPLDPQYLNLATPHTAMLPYSRLDFSLAFVVTLPGRDVGVLWALLGARPVVVVDEIFDGMSVGKEMVYKMFHRRGIEAIGSILSAP